MDKSLDAEVVVVGAGPAGSAAAVILARAGRQVLLVDRATFPRDKPCGDLIGARALAEARRLGIAEEVLRRYPSLRGAMVTADGGALDLVPRGNVGRRLLARTDARVIPRLVFDAAMVDAALDAGASLLRLAVRQVGPWHGSSREIVGRGAAGEMRLRARAVVLAGGYGCRVAPDLMAPSRRTCGPRPQPPRGIAQRGYFEGVTAPPDRIIFSLDRWVLPGYGWVFPLPGGGANVGVGTLVRDGEEGTGSGTDHLPQLYERFTSDPGSPAAAWLVGATATGPARSWPLDLGPRRRRLVADGAVVVGEAAGLVGPLTGAGIAFALESGARAGEVLATALAAGEPTALSLAHYARATRRQAAPWLRAELLAQRLLSDPARLRVLLDGLRPLPMTAALGARLLLHLG